VARKKIEKETSAIDGVGVDLSKETSTSADVGVDDVEVVKQIVKKRGGGGKNSPVIGDNGLMVEPGDNNKYTMLGLKIMLLPKIDLHDPEAVQKRIAEYFQIYADFDTKPTVVGLANALHIDRRRLWEIKVGATKGRGDIDTLPAETRDSIKRAYVFLEELWENFMLNGKINPVSGIFLGKNNYGYQDKTEYVVTPNTQQETDFNEEDIRKRYLTEGND